MTPPAQTWTWPRIVLWTLAAGVLLAWVGPSAWRMFVPNRNRPIDFFQEWSSARMYFEDKPIYGSLPLALKEYLGLEVTKKHAKDPLAEYNLHPPTSVLLTLPFGLLEFETACLVWNALTVLALIATTIIVIRAAEIPFCGWDLIPLAALITTSGPLQSHFHYVQLNLMLGLLLAGAWAADRVDRQALAGVLVGVATALKMFPAFCFLYFLMGWRWRALLTGGLTLAILNGVAALLFGISAFEDFIFKASPSVTPEFMGAWLNSSLMAFWTKLFGGGPDYLNYGTVLWQAPTMTRLLTVVSLGLVVAATAVVIYRARTQAARDHAFGATLIAMLLASPFTWDHTLMLLVFPGLLLWRGASLPEWTGVAFRICLALIWVNFFNVWKLLIDIRSTDWRLKSIEPWQTLTAVSYLTYALVFLLGLELWASRLADRVAADAAAPTAPATADGCPRGEQGSRITEPASSFFSR